MHVDTKHPNINLENIAKNLKRIMHPDQVGFIHKFKIGLTFKINQ